MNENIPCHTGRVIGKISISRDRKNLILTLLDDSSRLITCYGIFDSPTTENTITVPNMGFLEYGISREILTDHGSQFVSVWDRDLSYHLFKDFLDNRNIHHIIARVKRPQTQWEN